MLEVPVESARDPYVRWLGHQGSPPVLWGGGTCWRQYHGCLAPASLRPEPVQLTQTQAATLLEKSGALLLRYFSKILPHPTGFWYVACERYDFNALSSNMRSKIRRAYRHCKVERVDAAWLGQNAHPCYISAFARYRGSRPDSRGLFQYKLLNSVGGPFEYWAVFTGANLAGYAKCVIGDDYVATVVLKFDPDSLRAYSSYALWDTMLSNYVTAEAKSVTNGFRAFVHDTHVQDFVLSLGFRRIYCDLKVEYSRIFGLGVSALYPFKSMAGAIPDSWGGTNIRGMLMQEEVRRSFLSPRNVRTAPSVDCSAGRSEPMWKTKAASQPSPASPDSSQIYAGPEFERWAKAQGLIPAERFLIERYLSGAGNTLEAGVGGGRILRALLEQGFERTSGFDNVQALIEAAQLQDPSRKTAYTVQDAQSLPYADGEFDQIIYLQQIVSFIGDEAGRREAAAEAYRVLRPGGTALFSFLCYECRLQSLAMRGILAYLACFRALTLRHRTLQSMPWLWLRGRFNFAALLDHSPHVYWFRIPEAIRLLTEQQFEIIGMGTTSQTRQQTLCRSVEELQHASKSGMLYVVCRKQPITSVLAHP